MKTNSKQKQQQHAWNRVEVDWFCKFLGKGVWSKLPRWQRRENLKWFKETLRIVKNEGFFVIPNMGCTIQKHSDGTVTVNPHVIREEVSHV